MSGLLGAARRFRSRIPVLARAVSYRPIASKSSTSRPAKPSTSRPAAVPVPVPAVPYVRHQPPRSLDPFSISSWWMHRPATDRGQTAVYLPPATVDNPSGPLIYDKVLSKLRVLGIPGPIVSFTVYGGTPNLSTEAVAPLITKGVIFLHIESSLGQIENIVSRSMLEFTQFYQPEGSYIVLVWSGGTGLVEAAQALKKQGYGIVLFVPEGQEICAELRLAAEHCITFD